MRHRPTAKISPYDFRALLDEAEVLLRKHPYQNQFFAGKMKPTRTGKLKLQFCAMDDPDPQPLMLSLRGAFVKAAGSGSRAWPLIEFLTEYALISREEPLNRAAALEVIEEARLVLERENKQAS